MRWAHNQEADGSNPARVVFVFYSVLYRAANVLMTLTYAISENVLKIQSILTQLILIKGH